MNSSLEIAADQTAVDWLPGSDLIPQAAKDPIVLWVFREYDNVWCVRREGADIEAIFTSRAKALAFAREVGAAWGSYRLFLQLSDGRITRELFNTEPKPAVVAVARS